MCPGHQICQYILFLLHKNLSSEYTRFTIIFSILSNIKLSKRSWTGNSFSLLFESKEFSFKRARYSLCWYIKQQKHFNYFNIFGVIVSCLFNWILQAKAIGI